MLKDQIRVASPGDAEAILEIYAPIVIETAISFELEPPTVSEMQERIKNILIQFPWLVYEVDKKVVGYAYASTYRLRPAYQWSAEVTAYVHKQFHGQGVGKTLYKALFEILKKNGYYNAIAGIALPNAASVGLHEALGFSPVGVFSSLGYKHGRWHDAGFWQLKLQDYSAEPKPPIPFKG